MTTDLDAARFISFTTFKRDRTAVATPTWIVNYNGGYAFTTGVDSFKVRRLKNNPAVTLAASNYKGVVKASSPTHSASATLADATTTSAVDRLVRSKYKITYPLLISSGELWRKITKKPKTESVAVLITLAAN